MNNIEGKVIKLNKPGELGYKKDCLNVVGKVISDKKIKFKTYKNALLGMWENPQGVAVTDIGWKKMLFSFKDRKKGLQIMQNGPWSVKENMVNLRLWREGEFVFEVDHNYMEFWIQVHGIPHDFMEKETCILIGDMLGVLVEAEEPKTDGVLRRTYLRIRVSINITKALPTGFWLDRENLPPLWVFFKYERLPDSYCFNCGILGHEKKTCKNPTAMACWDPTKKKYAPGLGVSQGRTSPIMGGGTSEQGGWRQNGEEQAREQRTPERESSEERSSEESRFMAQRVSQQKIREESVWENQMRREEEMVDAEEQVEEDPRIPDFQEKGDTQQDLGTAYKISNLIKEIRERKNEWANIQKAQKEERRNEAKETYANEHTREIGPKTGALYQQARKGEGTGLNKFTTEGEEVNSYKIGEWHMGQENKEKETIGQELKRLMLARKWTKQTCETRIEEKENQELMKGEKEKNALRSPSEEAQNAKQKGVDQQVKPGENIYYIELASDEDEEKGTEAQTVWKTGLAKKLELKLNLKRKRETEKIPMLTYREEQEDQEDREPKKTKNSFNTKTTGDWNCRGIAAASTVSELHNLCKKVKPLIVFLMETRANQDRMNRIRRRLNFDKSFCVEPRGLSGGLCLLRKSNTNINVYEWCDNYIKASININNGMNWQGVFVYGNPVFQKRRRLWQELTVNNRSREEPQAFLGDFNDILSQDEKVGLHPQPRIYLNTFKRFVDENLLMDIDLKGSRYTWYSNPRNNLITRERLDRVLVNWKWLNIHQNVILRAAPAISSDHCALILETQPRDRIKKEFKFEAFWAEYEECEEVVRRSWEQDAGNKNCWSQFNRNRSKCIRELMEWSRRKFKRAYKEIEKKKEELHQI
ncbi:hypothetical protein Ahy_B10g101521 [Arachis hypogaea]|uniref:CCHC-type domain-containing protein n=1 Tax=Arachis hypogaea TaxID=3818 RepID=A0A444WZT4_ARAHY|nr:hypothetical protein Ahy_B10g101521 [Arachis hypogaea]